MYWAREVSDNQYIGDIYFIVMVFLGAYIVINLIIAVQVASFADSKQEVENDDEDESDKNKEPDTEEERFQKYRALHPINRENEEIYSG